MYANEWTRVGSLLPGDRLRTAAGSACGGPVRPRHDFWRRQGPVRGRRSRRHGHGQEPADAGTGNGGHRCERLLHDDHAPAGALRRGRRTRRVQEGEPHGRGARRRRRHQRGVHARGGQPRRNGHGRRAGHADSDRRGPPEDRRGQGHRAALVFGPQPYRRPRHESGRHWQRLQQRGLLVAHQRRLQHERQPRGRKHDLCGRRHRHPHAVGRRHDRRPERGRGPGSPGADGQLPARVRARKRRADPVHHQEREQPLLGQRVVLLPRRPAAGQYLGAQPQPQRHREQRAGAVRLQAVRLFLRRADPGRDVQEQVLLLRRAGMAELLRGADEYRRRAHRRDEERRLQPVAGREPVLQHAPGHSRPAHGPALPGQHHPGEPPVAERHRADEALPIADARVPIGIVEPHHQQRQPAGPAEGQHPVRLPPGQQSLVHVPLLEVQLGRD